MQGWCWHDLEADHGAHMDAPSTWHPAGAMQARHFTAGDSSWVVRSGWVLAPVIPPARQVMCVDVDGVRYRVQLERCGGAQRLAEARACAPRAKPLRQGSPTWYRVEEASWRMVA